MTLIITALSDNYIAQVSDRRLTLNGAIYDDFAVKALCVSCADASFCLAYTGLAEINGCRTDEWLVDYLASIRASEMSFLDLFNALQTKAAYTFARLRNIVSMRGITFVLAGFGSPGPFVAVLSNIEGEDGNWLGDIDDNFQKRVYFRNNNPMRKIDLIINGTESAVEVPFKKVVQKVRGRYLNKSPEETVAVLVQLIRMAAEHPKVGYMIGRNCMSAVVNQTGNFLANDHPENKSAHEYMPHAILRGVAYKNIEIWTGDGPPPWRTA